MSARTAVLMAAMGLSGCTIPLLSADVTPPARLPGTVEILVREVGVSENVEEGISRGTVVTVGLDLRNVGTTDQRVAIAGSRLLLQPAGDQPEVHGTPVAVGEPPLPKNRRSSGLGRPVSPEPTVVKPGESRSLWIEFGGFADHHGDRPLRVVLEMPAGEGPPRRLIIGDNAPGAPRWTSPRRQLMSTFRSSWSALAAGRYLLEPLGVGSWWARGRFHLGLTLELGFLFDETLAGGPPALVQSIGFTAAWQPFGFPIGAFLATELGVAAQDPPAAYRRFARSRTFFLPAVGAGFQLGWGRRRADGPLPIDRPSFSFRRGVWRVGYVHWFDMGEADGSPGFTTSVEVAM